MGAEIARNNRFSPRLYFADSDVQSLTLDADDLQVSTPGRRSYMATVNSKSNVFLWIAKYSCFLIRGRLRKVQ